MARRDTGTDDPRVRVRAGKGSRPRTKDRPDWSSKPLGRVIGMDRYHFRESTKKDEREIQRLQSQVDSLIAVKQDSVYVSVPYPVERELTKWEQARMDAGGFIICLGAAVVLMGAIALIIKWIVRKKRRV